MAATAVHGAQYQRPGPVRSSGGSVDKIYPPVSGRTSFSGSRPQTPVGPSGRPLVGRSSSTSSHSHNTIPPHRLTPSPAPSSSSASASNPYPTRPQPHLRAFSFPFAMASSISLNRSGQSDQHRNPHSFARFRDPFEGGSNSGNGSGVGSGGASGVGGVSSTASKLMTSVKRTLSMTAKKLDTRPTFPYATPYETGLDVPRRPPPAAPPTLAEIAQGLIPIRTPQPRRTPRPPTPPLVSSLKRTDRDSSFTNASSTASSSSMPTTPTSSIASRTAPARRKIGLALSRFYSRDSKTNTNGAQGSNGTQKPSPADSSVSLPRKAVRFSTSEGAGHSALDLPDSEWSRSTSALGMNPPGLERTPSEMSRSTSAAHGRSTSEQGHGGIGRVTTTISEYAFMRRTFMRSRDSGEGVVNMDRGDTRQAASGVNRGGESNTAGPASSPSAFRLFNRNAINIILNRGTG